MAPRSPESLPQPVYDETFFADANRCQNLDQEITDGLFPQPDAPMSLTAKFAYSSVILGGVDVALFLAKAPIELRDIVEDVSFGAVALAFTSLRAGSLERKQRKIFQINQKYVQAELPREHPNDPRGVALIGPVEYDWPPRDYGGVERDIVAVARGLGRAGTRTFAFGTGTSDAAELAKRVDGTNLVNLVPVVRESLANSPSKKAYAQQQAQARDRVVRGVRFLIDQRQVDLLDVRWEDAELLDRLTDLAIREKVPLVMHFSGTPNEHTGAILSTFGRAGLVYRATSWTTLSRAHKMGIQENLYTPYSRFLTRLPYGISFEDAPSPGEQPLATTVERPTLPLLQELQDLGKNYIIHPGTIGPRKSQSKTIEAFKQAKARGYLGDNTVFVIMGEPSPTHEDALHYHQKFVLPHIDNKDIFYFGPANEAQKWQLLRFAVASMFASGMEVNYTEAFCRLLAESAGVGTPVVGYTSATFEEIMEKEITGIGFTTVEEAARELGRVKSLDRIACAKYAREKYSDERMIEWLIQTYRSLIRDKDLEKKH